MNLCDKYTIVENQIVNRTTGIPIPPEEPVMIFRASDAKSVFAILAYIHACENVEHKNAIQRRYDEFEAFAKANPGRMKEPD